MGLRGDRWCRAAWCGRLWRGAEWCEVCVKGRSRNKPHCRRKNEIGSDGERDAKEEDSSLCPRTSVESENVLQPVPRVIMDDFFLGANAGVKEKKSASSLSTHQLRQRLKAAGLPARGGRKYLVKRYDEFVKETLAEAGLSSPSESEDEKEDEGGIFELGSVCQHSIVCQQSGEEKRPTL